MAKKPTIVELGMNELEDLLRRTETHELREEDYETTKTVLLSYVELVGLLKDKNVSIGRLRKLLFGSKTEKAADILAGIAGEAASSPADGEQPSDSGDASPLAPSKSPPPKKGHGRNGAEDYTGAEQIDVSHESLQPGDDCPSCLKGTLYDTQRPRVLVRLTGQAPVGAKVIRLQQLRCNLCGKLYTASAPEGVGPAKYDATVGSMIALLKYGSGLPFNRQAGLQGLLGIPLPASTQWDIVLAQAQHFRPVWDELLNQAANGDVQYNDDTTVRILERMGKRAEKKASKDALCEDSEAEIDKSRTGLFTSGVVSTHSGWRIALFFSGVRHAGENLKKVLARRAEELGPPIQMCDALSRNVPGPLKTILANCLAHARRRFVDVVENFPEPCRHVLEALKVVYHNDATARKRKLSAETRLAFHQAHSGPTMERLKVWLTEQFEQRLVEPNSSLGGAVAYMLKHWEKLTLFLRVPGAPLDNNLCEQALKKAILHRKNALFYKSDQGAQVGDLYMSLIYTCQLNKVNPFDYLTELERHADQIVCHPERWMPWNYGETLTAP
jgi:hypothetical protein